MGVQHSSADQFTPNMEAVPDNVLTSQSPLWWPGYWAPAIYCPPMSTPQLSSSLQFDIYNLRSILYNFEFPIYNLPFVIHNLQLPIYYSPPYKDMIRLNKKITVYNFEFTIYNFAPLCQSLSPCSFVHQLHPAEFTNTWKSPQFTRYPFVSWNL